MFQAGAVAECAAALLFFRYPSFTDKPEQNITTKIHAKRDDGLVTSVVRSSSSPWRNALWLKVAQCSLVGNAMHFGKKRSIREFVSPSIYLS